MVRALSGCYAKIERADQLKDDLQQSMQASANDIAIGIRSQFHPEKKTLSLHFCNCKELPLSWSVKVGEVLYQLRSALDHLVWSLIIANKSTPTTKSQFPIFKAQRLFADRGLSMINGISPAAKNLIVSLQPYRAIVPEGEYLWMLHELNNIDKHRLLIILEMFMGLTGGMDGDIKFEPPLTIKKGAQVSFITRTPIKDGEIFAEFEAEHDARAKINAKIQIEITLAELGMPKNQPIIPLLDEFTRQVRQTVELFETEFCSD